MFFMHVLNVFLQKCKEHVFYVFFLNLQIDVFNIYDAFYTPSQLGEAS